MDGSRIVTPARMCASLRRTRRLHSAAASCDAVVDARRSGRRPRRRRRSRAGRPRARAGRARSGTARRSRATARARRSGDAARRRRRRRCPALISLPVELLRGRVLRLDDPLDRAELAADHPPELGRVGGEDAGQRDRGIVLAARLEDGVEVGAGRGAARRPSGRGSRSRRPARPRAPRADRVAGAARLVLEREVARSRERRATIASTGGEYTTIGGRTGRRRSAGRSPRRRGRRPASAGRTAGGGPWAARAHPRAEAGRQDDGRGRVGRSTGAGLGGFTRGGAVGRRSRAGVAPGADRARREVIQRHQWVGGMVGAARRGVSSTRPAGDGLDLDPGALRQGRHANVERAGGGSGKNAA